MAKRILLPLRGREGDEAMVPVVGALARDSGATVRLLRVFPVPGNIVGTRGRVVAYADQEMDRMTGEGLDHLRAVEARLHGVPVESVVRFGDPAEEILLEAEAFDADLVTLTDGSHWLRRMLVPGVAEQVARKADVPVMLLRER